MRRHLSLALALAGKDWALFWADRRAATLAFLVPIVLASGFGLVFDRGPGHAGDPKLALVVVVEGGGAFTEQVVADLIANPRVEAQRVAAGRAEACVADRRPGVAVTFPADFDALKDWLPGSTAAKPTVRVAYNPLCASEGQWAEGVVWDAAMRRLAKARLGERAADAGTPFAVRTAPLAGPEQSKFNAYSHSFSGMTLQYLLFWGMESGLLLLRDRQRSVWTRLRCAPVPLSALLAGRAAATAAIAFLQVLATFAAGYLLFGVTVTGSWLGFLLLALGASCLSASTGLLVAAVGGTEARARSICILVILGVSMLGGLWLPSFVLPGWARDLALTLPTTWAMRGLDGVTWQGHGLLATLPGVGVVAAFAGVFLTVAVAKLVSSEARRRRGIA